MGDNGWQIGRSFELHVIPIAHETYFLGSSIADMNENI
jgi:hypothetical protein